MRTIDRRESLQLFTGLASAAMLFISGGPAFAAQGTAITFPHGEFILRRELEREMARGATLLVARAWRGRFETDGETALVTGEQISSRVVAPAHLEPIAAIERERRSSGPFPARLDMDGRIVGEATGSAAGKAEAVKAAMAVLERAGHTLGQLHESKAYLDRLASSADAMTRKIPADLFFPVVGEASERRTLTLPGGEEGQVSVFLKASAGPGGLLDTFERRIATRVRDDARLARESWSLRVE